MKSKPRIGIAGGGLLGRLCAWRLSNQGYAVSVFEAGSLDIPASAGWTAAGMLAPLSELAECSVPVYEMGTASLPLWQAWIPELEAQSGVQVPFQVQGSLLLAHAQDANLLHQFEEKLRIKLGPEAQSSLTQSAERMNAQGIRELEPDIAPQFRQGLWLKPEGAIHSRRLFEALLRALEKQGVDLRPNSPVRHCDSRKITLEDGTAWQGDTILDLRGTGSQSQVEGLRGVRGEVLLVESPELRLRRPVRLMHPRYQIYAVPRLNGQILIGATEIESSDFSPPSVRSVLELSSALYTLSPSLGEARILEMQANCRPALPDNHPRVDASEGLIRANGLYRHGYLIAPAVVQQVCQSLNQQCSVDASQGLREATL